MGEALTYKDGTLSIEYKDKDGIPVADYSTNNMTGFEIAEGNHAFTFKLAELRNSNIAVVKYSAHVDYTKLGGKENIETTTRNTVTAKDKDNKLLAEAHAELEKEIDYLQLGKSRGEIVYKNANDETITNEGHSEDEHYVTHNWKDMYVKWTVIYNPDAEINVEGATLKDQVWKGRKSATTYDTSQPFIVTAYPKGSGTYTKGDGPGGDKFTPNAGAQGIVIKDNWNDVTVTKYGIEDGSEQLSTWEWTIPPKTTEMEQANTQYTYVVEYYTKIEHKEGDSGSYVGNRVAESIADITRDRSVELPGIGPGTDIKVEKTHLKDEYVKATDSTSSKVYSQWEIKFARRTYDLERALVEDTLPHIKIDGVVRTDTFVDTPIADDAAHGWEVKGLYSDTGERCVPSVSMDGYDVIFEFFTNYVAKDNPLNVEGLKGARNANDGITITFWTENNKTWIDKAAEGRAPQEHWNHVHLVLNGKEATDDAFGVPKPESSLEKSVKEVGTWTNTYGVSLPVYRYTLTLNGVTDNAFTTDKDGNKILTITDEFNSILSYLPANALPVANEEGTISGNNVKLSSRDTSDETLVCTLPKIDDTWPAIITGGNAESSTDSTKKSITITITMTPDDWQKMKYEVKGVDGETTYIDPKTQQPVKVYGKSYEVSYYLAPDHIKVKEEAQRVVTAHSQETTLTFNNTAKWHNGDAEAGKSEMSATVDYNLKPVGKELLNYDEESELATYRIVLNPLRLTMNGGQRYPVTDEYTNLAVDFQTVDIKTEPESKRDEVEWSYHNNKGVFWIPDETKVTITYEGWPVGRRGNANMEFSNTVKIGDYSDNETHTAKLSVDHEGYASTYRVRIFKFEDDNMDTPLPGAVFQLFENGPDGKIREMTYHAAHHTDNPNEDDAMWKEVNADRSANNETLFPTPENHNVGDKIYFVTGDGRDNDVEHSAQAGFADVMLSQSRDGVALKKGKQYYLREVKEPDGHIKEDIDWRFIIGDNDDWESYVYSDDSILQVSNASVDPVLTVRKTFVDRSNSLSIGFDPYQKKTEFEIVGTDLVNTENIIYNKTVSYDSFARGSTENERLLIINDLKPGKYIVREKRESAAIDNTTLTTYVEGSASAHEEDAEHNIKPNSETAVETRAENSGSTSGDSVFHFTVLANRYPNEYLTKTTAEANFTNIYTDEEPVSFTVEKSWNQGNTNGFTPKQSEFAIYADGEKYDLTPAEGGNERGNLVITAGSNGDGGWANQVIVSSLPRKNKSDQDIVWTVEEVGATYHMQGHPEDTTVSGFLLHEHFAVTATTARVGNTDRYAVGNEGAVSFTNKLNSLITVIVDKKWDDGNDNHTHDSVFFDLYRTHRDLNHIHEYHSQLQTIINEDGLTPIIENIELNASNNWRYQNHLMEKYSENDNLLWQYFAVERSVAGYVDSYDIVDVVQHDQDITITNTPLENDPKGSLSIQKQIEGTQLPNDLSKTFKFTLWNSGKYLHEDGTLTNERHVFEVHAGDSALPTTLQNVKLGTYVLTEIEDDAQIGGYDLTGTKVVIDDGTPVLITDSGLAIDVPMTNDSTPKAVVVTNTYEKQVTEPTTDFTFGKLWVMPNTQDTTTLVWPEYVSTTMKVQRRIKGQTNADPGWSYEYTFSKGTADDIASTPPTASDAPVLTVHNPDEAPSGANTVGSYHHYTFELKDLQKYNEYGQEWEYFAVETAVTDTANNNANLLDPENPTGRAFSTEYGHVDGIGAYSYATDSEVENKADASANDNGLVECAINRLEITKTVDIPVQKFINGTANWGATTGSSAYPQFSFTLYDEFGHAVLDKPAVEGGKHITATTNQNGQAHFYLPETLIDPNDMIWRIDEEILYGSHTFWIKEDDIDNPAAAGSLDALYQYYGIEKYSGAAKVTLTVRYDWKSGELKSTAKVSNADYSHTDDGGRERAVINNTYQTDETELTVSKTWDDENNQDGYRRPIHFKVHASYTTKEANGQNVKHELDKVWLTKVVKVGKVHTIVREDDIVLDNSSDKSKEEYRITIEPSGNVTDTKTVTLPKYYEGHAIQYTVEEMRNESIIEEGTGGADNVTLLNKYEEIPAIARIGNTYYKTFLDAVNGATDGSVIELLADDNSLGNEGITINTNLTINGRGHTITGNNGAGFNVQSGTVTISDLNMTQFGSPAVSATDGTVTLSNMNITTFNGTAISINGGDFTISGGTIDGNDTNYGIKIESTATGTIDGITVRGANGIVNESTGNVTLTNVNIVVSDTGISAYAGTTTITGDKTYVKAAENQALVTTNEGRFSIEAGAYSNAVDGTYCAMGYVPSEKLDNGTWTVVWGHTAVPEVACGLVYNGTPQTGVASGDGYTVTTGGSATDAGVYAATLELANDYKWSDGTSGTKTIEWAIDKAEIDVPVAATGLVYNGTVQTGVPSGTGYTVEEGTAPDAGIHTATVTPDANHEFADGATSQPVEWSIAWAHAIVRANDASKKKGDSDPVLTATVLGTYANDSLVYTVTRTAAETEGAHIITASGEHVQGNYTVSYEHGTFIILPETLDSNAVAYTMNTDGTVSAFQTLADAVAHASAGDGHTVRLLKDIELDMPLSVNGNVVIDGTKNGGGTYTIRTTNDASSVNPLIQVSGTGDLALSNVTVDANGKGRAIVVKGGALTLNDGTKVTGGSTPSSFIGGVYMTGQSTFTMNGGEISGNSVSSQYESDRYLQYSADLWIGSEATGTMNGGTVGNLFVNSNEFTKPSAGFTQNGGSITNAYLEYDQDKASLTHNGGTLTNLYIATDDAHGTTHNTSPETITNPMSGATYIPYSGVVRVEDNSGVQDYNSFEEAISHANEGDTITLLADATVNSTVVLDRSLTVNLNGHTLSGASDTSLVFQVIQDATLTMNGTQSGSAFVGRINVGGKPNINGNIVLNGGDYYCGSGQTVLHVNGTCTNSNVTIMNATITSPDDNGIQLNGAGTHTIMNSTISGKTAVYLKAGTLSVQGSTLLSTAASHTDYAYSGTGSNPTGDAIVVDSCAYPGGNPTLTLGTGNHLHIEADSGNVQVGYYKSNTTQNGYEAGIVVATTNDRSLPDGYAWAEQRDGTYRIGKAWTVAFDSAGADVVDSQQVVNGRRAVEPAEPSRTHKKFLGWFAPGAESPFDFEKTTITENTILTAKWADVQTVPTGEPQYTNKHIPEKINVSVEKQWNHNGRTPEPDLSVKVFLKATYSNAQGQEKTVTYKNIADTSAWSSYSSAFNEVTLQESPDAWKKQWQGLPRYAPGEVGALVTYTVEEDAETIPIGYKVTRESGSGTANPDKDGIPDTSDTSAQTIKNEYVSVDIPLLKKEWKDDDNRDGLRPTSVNYQLTATASGKDIISNLKYKNGTTVTDITRTLSSNDWSATGWSNLPGYYQGELISYKGTETTVLNGYTASEITHSAEDTSISEATITNTHEIARRDIVLTKNW